MSVKFGTSGLRGLSTELMGMPSALYVSAFCKHLLEKGLASKGDAILVGQDFRDSSPEIATSSMGAIRNCGFMPVDCGNIPTPALCNYGFKRKAASIMITGSHIPADRNGIKFYLPDGEIAKEDEVAITEWAQKLAGTVTLEKGAGADEGAAARDLFFARNTSILPANALKGMKIGVYQHSTVARDQFVDVLAHYGADVMTLGRSENFIPVDTEAVSAETIGLLKKWAWEGKLDAIVSADGDADRPLVTDETGQPLKGDLLGLMTAQFLGAEVIVTPVTSNSGIEANGRFTVLRTKVGSPYVIAGMDQAKAEGKNSIVGFEANGGFLTATPINIGGRELAPLPTRDCFLPILCALYLAANRKEPVSVVASEFRLPVALADRIQNFAQTRSAALMEYLRGSDDNLAAFLKPVGTVAERSDIDGLRVTLADKRVIHFRPSGNAPEMRCYVEAESDAAATALLRQGLGLIEAFPAA